MTQLSARALGLFLAAITLGCGASTPSNPAPSSPGGAGTAGGPGTAPPAGSTPAAGTGASAQPAAACDFRVGETCFATDTEACAAAGCKPGGCIVLESYPAQITCK